MKNVLLIGLDGATFTVLDRLMSSGDMPYLAKLQTQSARAPLASVVPPLTPPAWTSLMTGQRPGSHGIFDFFQMESRETRHIRFATANDILCETIWERASSNGFRTTVLNFPLMFPPPKINGNVIPGWVPWRQLRLACWPKDLFDRLTGIPGFDPKELAMDMREEERATEGCEESELEAWVDAHIRRERCWHQVLTHLMQTDPSPLTAVIFDGTDRLQHLCWRFIDTDGDNLKTPLEHRIRSRTLEYFHELDGILQQLIENAGPDTTVLIASDHGFGPTQAVFHLNAWLASHGYLVWRNQQESQDEKSGLLGVGKVARHTFEIDWDKTCAFATTPTSNALYIVSSEHGSAGIPPENYIDFRERLKQELLQVKIPETGQQLVTRIWSKEEAFDGPAIQNAPDLTLSLFDGGLISILPSDQIISQRPAVAGTHRSDGVFFAKGPGIKTGAQLPEMSIMDVAPLILHRLGLGIPENMEGRVPEGIFEERELARNPIRTDPAETTRTTTKHTRRTMGAEEEEILLERLRQLGYVE